MRAALCQVFMEEQRVSGSASQQVQRRGYRFKVRRRDECSIDQNFKCRSFDSLRYAPVAQDDNVWFWFFDANSERWRL